MSYTERERAIEELSRSGLVKSYTCLDLFTSLPVDFQVRVPFTNFHFNFGGRNLSRHRRAVARKPEDADTHTNLAALLLSQVPVTNEYAIEAEQELRVALALLANTHMREECELQTVAMVHQFLGDALLELDRLPEARSHWQKAVELDPVRPPFGFSGLAMEQLNRHS